MDAYILGLVKGHKVRIYDRTPSAEVKLYDYGLDAVTRAIYDHKIKINNAIIKGSGIYVDGTRIDKLLYLDKEVIRRFLISAAIISDTEYEFIIVDSVGNEERLIIPNNIIYNQFKNRLGKLSNVTLVDNTENRELSNLVDTINTNLGYFKIRTSIGYYTIGDKREPTEKDILAYERWGMIGESPLGNKLKAYDIVSTYREIGIIHSKKFDKVEVCEPSLHTPINWRDIKKTSNANKLIKHLKSEEEIFSGLQDKTMPTECAVIINSLSRIYPKLALNSIGFNSIINYTADKSTIDCLVRGIEKNIVWNIHVAQISTLVSETKRYRCRSVIAISFGGSIVASFVIFSMPNDDGSFPNEISRLLYYYNNDWNYNTEQEISRTLKVGDRIGDYSNWDDPEELYRDHILFPKEIGIPMIEGMRFHSIQFHLYSDLTQCITSTGWLTEYRTLNMCYIISRSEQSDGIKPPEVYKQTNKYRNNVVARDELLRIAYGI